MNVCNACGSELGDILFNLKDIPIVDSFKKSKKLAEDVPRITIDISQCINCKTVQITQPISTSEIYLNYIYESSSSPDLNSHFNSYAESILRNFSTENKILEIGLNDGLLVRNLIKKGFKHIVGIDPSPQTGNLKIDGAEIINDFFSKGKIEDLRQYYHNYDIIISNNCFSHIPNLKEILESCRQLLSDEGLLVIEVQSLNDLLIKCAFDYIYHEHIFYHSLTSIDILCGMVGLRVNDVKHTKVKGGSYRFFISKSESTREISGNVNYFKYLERISNIHNSDCWVRMFQYLIDTKYKIQEYLQDEENVIGYGASATGTVLMRFFEIEDKIKYIVDDNYKRVGSFSPTTGIPVVAKENVQKNDLIFLTAWRHKNAIFNQIKHLPNRILLPMPYPKLIDE